MRSTITIRRPSASLVVAMLALFVALGGTGYAAATLSGKAIQKHSIPGNRLRFNTLTGKQIKESKLGPVPVAQRALTAETAATATTATSATTATTADSATTAQNALQLQGHDAGAFMANSVRVALREVTVATGSANAVTASCAGNEKGIGGGAAWIIPGTETPTQLDAQLNSSLPVPTTGGTNNMTGWSAVGVNRTGANRLLRAYVVCVPKTV